MEHNYYTPQPQQTQTPDPKAALQAAVSSFRENVQEATGKLAAAAEQFGTMGERLIAAIDEARSAADRAEAAQKAAEAAQAGAKADYEKMSNLARQLQERLGALAALAQPLDFGSANGQSEGGQAEGQGEGQAEAAAGTEATAEQPQQSQPGYWHSR